MRRVLQCGQCSLRVHRLYAEPLRTRRAALDWADSCAASLEPAHAQRYFFLAAGLDLAAFLAGLALFTGAFFAAGLVFSA
jgi:hypothetical protein